MRHEGGVAVTGVVERRWSRGPTIVVGNPFFCQFLDEFGHEPAFYRRDNTRAADAPARARYFCHLFTARILQTRPADAVPGQPLNT
ncbi:hypothetical protein [Kitasatospora purpeofusca]|uniref:hypothetical protein n=1 Tax=Kitasatospora purpeofusca TaxID=67352 RepID=UPI0035D60700